MFKNKRTLFILLPVNLFIWGYVGYTIYKSLNKENVSVDKVEMKAVFARKTLSDTLIYQLNYPDPFLKSGRNAQPAKTSNTSDKKSSIVKKAPVAVKTDNSPKWPSIVFQGIINDKKTNKDIALLSIDNRSYLLSKNDTVKGLKIKAITFDSVSVLMGKSIKHIRK